MFTDRFRSQGWSTHFHVWVTNKLLVKELPGRSRSLRCAASTCWRCVSSVAKTRGRGEFPKGSLIGAIHPSRRRSKRPSKKLDCRDTRLAPGVAWQTAAAGAGWRDLVSSLRLEMSPCHSWRSADMTGTRVARRAGR